MRYVLPLLVLAWTMSGALAAPPDAPDKKDIATINACFAKLEKGSSPPEKYEVTCLLKIANPCIGPDLGAASDRKVIDCFDREQQVWDKIVNDSYKTMIAGLDTDQAQKLREVQRAWIQMRETTCKFWYDFFQGTMANPMIASCNNRETARRAIYLRGFADEISQRK